MVETEVAGDTGQPGGEDLDRGDAPAGSDPVGDPGAGDAGRCPVAVIAPITSPVPPQTTLQLDGSASWSPGGTVVTFTWRLVSQPSGSAATIEPAGTATPTMLVDLLGSYDIELDISDVSGRSSCETATATVVCSNL